MSLENTQKFPIMCPSCKYEAFAGDVEPVIKEGYKCTNCSYKTEPGNDSLNKLVVIFLKEKKLIQAVKLYQSATKKGLKESKKGVDQIAAKYNIKMKQGCFIATACYGSYDASEVMVFRNYRDEVLLNSSIGRFFIKGYYFISPFPAKILEKSGLLRMIVKKILLNPLLHVLSGRKKINR